MRVAEQVEELDGAAGQPPAEVDPDQEQPAGERGQPLEEDLVENVGPGPELDLAMGGEVILMPPRLFCMDDYQ